MTPRWILMCIWFTLAVISAGLWQIVNRLDTIIAQRPLINFFPMNPKHKGPTP